MPEFEDVTQGMCKGCPEEVDSVCADCGCCLKCAEKAVDGNRAFCRSCICDLFLEKRAELEAMQFDLGQDGLAEIERLRGEVELAEQRCKRYHATAQQGLQDVVKMAGRLVENGKEVERLQGIVEEIRKEAAACRSEAADNKLKVFQLQAIEAKGE